MDSQWIELKVNRCSLRQEQVYCRPVKTKYKSIRMCMSIGLEVAKVLGWQTGDNVTVFSNSINPDHFMLGKSGRGYKLHLPDRSNTLTFAFALENFKNMDLGVTRSVLFRVSNGNLIIDISKIKNNQQFNLREEI